LRIESKFQAFVISTTATFTTGSAVPGKRDKKIKETTKIKFLNNFIIFIAKGAYPAKAVT